MKTASELFRAEHNQPTTEDSGQGHSSRMRYVMVAVLIVMAYLLSSWIPAESESGSFSIVPALLLFWLAGGGITLALLTIAAKKNS